jgi:hypothetical protein
LPEKVHNPGPEEQRCIRVEWGEVKEEGSGRLFIAGRLLLELDNGKKKVPVDWIQGVRVILARSSKDHPDWHKRQDEKDSFWSDCVTRRDGSFEARFFLELMRRTVGKPNSYQVAISLGKRGSFFSNSISFSNTTPVLPETIGTIKIPGSKPLSTTLQFINGAPTLLARHDGPVGLIRAVNHLHGLGKKEAMAALRAYRELSARGSWRCSEPDPANSDLADSLVIFSIVRLLFEPPIDEDAKSVKEYRFAMCPKPLTKEEKAWPLFPFALQDDLPFHLDSAQFGSGGWIDPSVILDWAEKYGKLRAKPLRPGDNPLLAAEALLAGKKPIPLIFDARKDLRLQAWRAVRHLVGNIQPIKQYRYDFAYDIDKDWEAHKKTASRLKIRWDEKKQEYVAGN